MAINPETQYPGKIAPSTPDYPYGSARNINAPGDGTGTPWEAALVNDLFGFQQAALGEAGIVPSGNPETAGVSQYLRALNFTKGKVLPDYAAVKAFDETRIQNGTAVFIVEAKRGGHFVWDSSDLSTEVTSDPGEGVYVAPDSDPTGANGAYRRIYIGAASVGWFGVVGDGAADDTTAFQRAVNFASLLIVPSGFSCLFSGALNSVVIDKSNFELVIATGAEIIKDDSGAAFYVGSTLSDFENITIRGGGVIRNPIVQHTAETTGILIGFSTNTIKNLTIRDLTINTSKYGIANGSQSTVLEDFILDGVRASVNVNGWAAGADVAQAFEMNLPSSAVVSTATITNSYFKITNQVSSKGDAFKFTNGIVKASNLDFVVDGQGQTVGVFSSMLRGSKIHHISAKVINSSGTIEDALQLNNSIGAEFQNLTGIVGATFGGGIQMGGCTDCVLDLLATNESIRQTNNTTMTDCKLTNVTAKSILFSQANSNWSKGEIRSALLTSQAFLGANDCDISDIIADMGGANLRGLYIRGDNNRVHSATIKNNTVTQAVQIEGDNNIIGSGALTLFNCHSAWDVVSGTNNKIGRINFQSPISTFAHNYVDNGTDTAYVHKLFGTISSGPHTFPIPNNPDGETTVEFADISANPTITNFTAAKDKDKVTIVITGASGNLTFDRTNAKLAGGADFVGNQWDTLTIQYDESSDEWYEISRSQNS